MNKTVEARFEEVQRRLALAYFGVDDPKLVQKSFPLNVAMAGKVPAGFEQSKEITLNRDMQDFSRSCNWST